MTNIDRAKRHIFEEVGCSDGYAECCGNCGMGLCYVDATTGEADEGWGWQNR